MRKHVIAYADKHANEDKHANDAQFLCHNGHSTITLNCKSKASRFCPSTVVLVLLRSDLDRNPEFRFSV